jgi:hypothetical protein
MSSRFSTFSKAIRLASRASTRPPRCEAEKLAYADRAAWLGDPDFVKVPLAGLTSKAYADQLRALISPDHARPAADIRPGEPQRYESDQTTHFSIVDADGNAVANTYTLNLPYGSGLVADGTGVLLNDELDDFAAKRGAANFFGLMGGDANAPGSMKRPLSSMSPTLVFKDGKVELVTGSPGGSTIITTVTQIIVNVIDYGLNVRRGPKRAARPRPALSRRAEDRARRVGRHDPAPRGDGTQGRGARGDRLGQHDRALARRRSDRGLGLAPEGDPGGGVLRERRLPGALIRPRDPRVHLLPHGPSRDGRSSERPIAGEGKAPSPA